MLASCRCLTTSGHAGKCGYKLLRYFAAGLPTIASPVGINATLVAGGHGLHATSHDDWFGAIEQLTADVTERQERGTAARRYVEAEYSYDVWAPRVAAILRDLASR